MTQPTNFRTGTTAQLVQQPDGRWEIVVVQVNALPITAADLDNKELVMRMALSTVNGYQITMSNSEMAHELRYAADQIDPG